MSWPLIVIAAIAAYLFLRAYVVEPYDLEVVERELHFAGLPEGLDGLRIAHLSDFHLERFDDVERRAIEAVRRADPDLICLTGDFIDDRKHLQFLVPYLMELCRGKRAYGVLGNHDYSERVDPEWLKRELGRAGVHLLVNEGVTERVRGVWITIAGVDDPHTGRADVARALKREQGSPSFTLMLAHSPDVLLDPGAAKADLVLCGHTHGGQVCLPFVGPLRTNTRIGRRAAQGEGEIGGARYYVSRGLGTSMLRLRLFCRPELAVLTLRRRTAP